MSENNDKIGWVEARYDIDPMVVAFPVEVVERAYRNYYESKDIELYEGEPDEDQLRDWLANHMNWEDVERICEEEDLRQPEVVGGPIVMKQKHRPDFEEEWHDAEKEIVWEGE